MDISAIENLVKKPANETQKPSQEKALREAAKQFEAVLLTQLTSVLNKTSNEDSLFGQDGGSDLAKKLFSEQLATAMAESGGIGLADVIVQQFSPNKLKNIPTPKNSLSNVIDAVKEVRSNKTDVSKLIDKSGKVIPVMNEANVGNNDFAVVSTDAKTYGKTDGNEDWRKAFTDKRFEIDATKPENMLPNQVSPVSKINSASKNTNEFLMPVEGIIHSKFGNRFHPIDKRVKFHGGVDIAAKRGTPIKATADGIVKFSGQNGGYGNMVIIEHLNGRISRYAHADKLLVKKDQQVEAGQTIATVGSTGKSTGPHLHFEMILDGKKIDPLKTISKVSVKYADK